MKKIKVYLAGSIAAGRDFENGIKLISNELEKLDFKILTKKNVVEGEKKLISSKTLQNRKYIMKRDKMWLRSADLFIAEVSQYSHGVGYEHAYAELQSKPILLLRHAKLKKQKYSAFLDGTNYRKFSFYFYNEKNIKDILIKFVNKYI